MGLYIIGGVIIIFIIWCLTTYNKFIHASELLENSKAQIAAQIESRWDAVKNIIDATKIYASYEAETLTEIVSQRTGIGRESSINEIEESETAFNEVIGKIVAIAEDYPRLKANNVYQTAMKTVDQHENNVRHARMIYNDVVTKNNRLVRMVPSNVIAHLFNFSLQDYFEETEAKREMPEWE